MDMSGKGGVLDGVEYNYELEEDDDDLIVTVTLPKK